RPYAGAPTLEMLPERAAIAGDVERRAAMVEHDRLIGKGAGEMKHVAKLRLEHPGVEGQPALAELGHPVAKGCVAIEAFGRVEGRAEHVRIGVPGGLMTHADEAGRRGLQGVEHFARRRTQPEVRMADDRRTGAVGAIKTACPLRGDAIDELDFADRLER